MIENNTNKVGGCIVYVRKELKASSNIIKCDIYKLLKITWTISTFPMGFIAYYTFSCCADGFINEMNVLFASFYYNMQD